MTLHVRQRAGSARRRAHSWLPTAWRGAVLVGRETLGHNLPQLAASLTYFTVLSLFPALLVGVALLGVVGLSPETLKHILTAVGEHTGSQWAVAFVADVLDTILASSATGVMLGLGLLGSLWTASAYIKSFMWTSDRIYELPLGRPYWKSIPVRVGLALALLVLFTAAVAMVALFGPAGHWAASTLGIPNGWLPGPSVLTWPLLVGVPLVTMTTLFKIAASRRQPPWWRLLPGAVLTLVLWALAAAGFSLYLAEFGAYNRVYGVLGAAVAFLVWAWLLNLALLVGAEVNRLLEQRRGEAAGEELRADA